MGEWALELIEAVAKRKMPCTYENLNPWFLGHLNSFEKLCISSCICHGVGPLVDLFWSHVSRNLFKGLPWFLLPVGAKCFITLGNILWGILFTCYIHFLLYSSNLSKIGVIFNSFAICVLCVVSEILIGSFNMEFWHFDSVAVISTDNAFIAPLVYIIHGKALVNWWLYWMCTLCNFVQQR